MSEINWVHKDSTTIKEVTDKETQQKVIENAKDYIIEKLQQENKQLKEELENIKDFNNKLQASKDRLDKDDYNLAHILIELEEYLKQEIENIKNNYSQINGNYFNMNYVIETYEIVLDKIQELKERYK